MEHPPRCSGNDLHAGFESVDVIGHTLATDADMNLHVEIVTSMGRCRSHLTLRRSADHGWEKLVSSSPGSPNE